jgi:hypothetical protein
LRANTPGACRYDPHAVFRNDDARSHGGPLLAYFGHHRCGTSWITQILAALARTLNRQYLETHLARTETAVATLLRETGTEVFSWTNAYGPMLGGLPPFRGFHVVRDPRDQVVSAYFSHRHSHVFDESWPDLESLREQLADLPFAEGLLVELLRSGWTLRNMADWDYARPDVLEVRLESLADEPYAGWVEIAGFLGILDEQPASLRGSITRVGRQLAARAAGGLGQADWLRGSRVPVEEVLGIVWQHRFSVLSGRERGEHDIENHYRSGVAGDWRRYFGPEHVEAFKELHNDLLIRLGYEATADWGLDLETAR